MSRILCVTSGLMGITNASLELVQRLRNDGHEVVYASPKDRSDIMQKQGVDFQLLDEILADPSPIVPVQNKLGRLFYKWTHNEERRKQAMANFVPQQFIDFIRQQDFDLIIIDMELHEYVIATHKLGKKILLLSQWFSIWRARKLPYILTDIIPGRGLRGKEVSISLHWRFIKWKRRWSFFKRRMISGGTNRASMIKRYAKESSFPKRLMGENYWPGPFLFESLPMVSMTDENLEFPHEKRANLKYLGPMVMGDRVEEVGDELRQFIDQAKNRNRPLIYVSFSTLSVSDDVFLQKVLECASTRQKWDFIISVGASAEREMLSSNLKNVLIFDQVAQLFVLRHADCSLNHGGIHTINECLYHAVPMLVYSGKKSDQNGCAARVHFHELGMMADKDEDDVQTIGEKIERVLQNEDYKRNCEKCRRKIMSWKEDKTVEKIMNEYITN